MELKDFINKHKNKILNIAIIILALIVANNIYKNQTRTIESLKQNKEQEIKKNTVLEDIKRLEEKISSYEKTLDKKDVSLMMNIFNNIAKEAGIKIISIRPQDEKVYPVYTKYSFDLVLSAKDYYRIGKFISNIENAPGIYSVDRINIRSFSREARGEGAAWQTRGLSEQMIDKTDKIRVDLTISTIFLK